MKSCYLIKTSDCVSQINAVKIFRVFCFKEKNSWKIKNEYYSSFDVNRYPYLLAHLPMYCDESLTMMIDDFCYTVSNMKACVQFESLARSYWYDSHSNIYGQNAHKWQKQYASLYNNTHARLMDKLFTVHFLLDSDTIIQPIKNEALVKQKNRICITVTQLVVMTIEE